MCAELDGPWNAFRNGWSMLVTGDSRNSTDGAPFRKCIGRGKKVSASLEVLRVVVLDFSFDQIFTRLDTKITDLSFMACFL